MLGSVVLCAVVSTYNGVTQLVQKQRWSETKSVLKGSPANSFYYTLSFYRNQYN